ncbi:unnamed protein product [Lepeophtheirus salmonis]|uniref:(salmon louse) hypothetical protein n=1 Tax=Lepeophtheirus salmonis TaxID=72036 RepID=A0A7R8CRD1_LEPSM|nr:unnamed protein product [Lepeophtheirus salmonis]CAF2867264.1 unnamed protein product [Lepeophtheirus salmonis]
MIRFEALWINTHIASSASVISTPLSKLGLLAHLANTFCVTFEVHQVIVLIIPFYGACLHLYSGLSCFWILQHGKHRRHTLPHKVDLAHLFLSFALIELASSSKKSSGLKHHIMYGPILSFCS